MRIATVERNTKETQITLTLNLDGHGIYNVENPIGFLGHMLNTFCKHSLFDLEGKIQGDLEVDQHHLIEDTGIVLGECLLKALKDSRGITRTAFSFFPMDETLARAAVDLGGRPYLVCDLQLDNTPLVSINGNGVQSSFQVDCIEDFFIGFTSKALCNLHLTILYGRSSHHKIEAIFKAVALAIRKATEIDKRRENDIPSTKGVII